MDACILFAETNEVIDEAVQQLRDAELDLNVEEDVAGFLGISMEVQPLSQLKTNPHLNGRPTLRIYSTPAERDS